MVTITPWPIVDFSMRVVPTAGDPRGTGPRPPNHVNNPGAAVWVPAAIVEIIQAAAPRKVRLVVLSLEPFHVVADEFDPAVPRYGTFKLIGPTLLSETFDLTAPNIAAGSQLMPAAFAVAGAQLGDTASASWDADLQGMQLTAHVSGPGQVRVVLRNGTAAGINLGPGTLRIDVLRH